MVGILPVFFAILKYIQARKGQNSQVDFLANRRLVNAFFTAFYPAEAVEKRALLLLFFFLRAVWFCQQ